MLDRKAHAKLSCPFSNASTHLLLSIHLLSSPLLSVDMEWVFFFRPVRPGFVASLLFLSTKHEVVQQLLSCVGRRRFSLSTSVEKNERAFVSDRVFTI